MLSAYPDEAVALVVGADVVRVDNISDTPDKAFKIDPAQYLMNQPEALLHSHVYQIGVAVQHGYDLRTPSYSDFQHQRQTGIPWGISATDGEAVSDLLWFPQSRNADLLGRKFCYYVNDCYTLIRDYYYQNRGIILQDYPDVDVYNRGNGITYQPYLTNLADFGFEQIPLSQAEPGDMLLMKMQSDYDHGAVMIDQTRVLNQFENKLSAYYSIGKLRSFIRGAARYCGE